MQYGKKFEIVLFATLVAAVIVASLSLFQGGFIPTHDGEYHLIRFFEFEKMLLAGYWFPRWAAGLNSGFGVPLFNFNYPFPNYVGVLFHSFGFSLADSLKLTLATGYIAAVLFCFLWLKRLFSERIALFASVIFAFVPYWFVDIYVRGSVGEVLALAWVMLALASIEREWAIAFIFSVAGLILSHNILAIIFIPLLLGYLVIRKPPYIKFILISLGLSAYFWIPALLERQYVTGLNPVNFRDHFAQVSDLLIPSWGTGFSGSTDFANRMSFQIGIVPLFILVLAIIFFLKEKTKDMKILIGFVLATAFMSAFLTLKYSLSFWNLFPFMAFIQYPWRFLSVLLPVTGLLAAYVLSKFKSIWPTLIIAFVTVVLSYSYTRPAVYAPRDDTYYLTRTNFTDGTSSLGNAFSTIWSPWKPTRAATKIEIVEGKGNLTHQIMKPLEYAFEANMIMPSVIRINTLYYPGWRVSIDGISSTIDYLKDGTIRFTIAEKMHTVKVTFQETRLRRVADLISILSLFWLVGWAILKKYYENRHRHNRS